MLKQNHQVAVPIDEVLIAIALLIDVHGQSRAFNRIPTLQELWMRNQDRAQWLFEDRRLGEEPYNAPTEALPTANPTLKQ